MPEQVTDNWVQGELAKLALSALALLFGVVLNAVRAYYGVLREQALAQAGRLADDGLQAAVRELVHAAEQRLAELGGRMGESKLALVRKWAAERGLQVDDARIEAAVYRMNCARPAGRAEEGAGQESE